MTEASEAKPKLSSEWAVALLAIIAPLPSILCGYIYDDVMLIVENHYVQHLRYIGRAFTKHFWNIPAFGSAGIGLTYYRPLVTVSYLLNWVTGGGAPWLFHAWNIACHALCALLVVRIGRRWIGDERLAALAGLIFAIHPSRTESVIWVAGRTDVMMTLFLLLAMELVAQREPAAKTRLSKALATLCVVLALLCKEAALMAPALLAVEWLTERDGVARKDLFKTGLGWLGIDVVYVALRAVWMPLSPEHSQLSFRHGLYTLGIYLERIVWPWPQTFFFRPLRELGGHVVFSWPHLLAGSLFVAATFAMLLRTASKTKTERPELANNLPLRASAIVLGAALFMGPLLNFTSTGIFVSSSDHFLYLPLWLLAVGAFVWWREPLARWMAQRSAAGLIGILSLVCCAAFWARAIECRDNDSLWNRELEINPDNPFVLREVATRYASQGALDEAQALFERSLSPASLQYSMLAAPGSNLEVHHRVVSLEAALRADGDVVALRALYAELTNLAEGRLGQHHELVGRAELGRSFSALEMEKALGKERMRPEWRAEAAFVATRLCRNAEARRQLDQIPDLYLRSVVSPENLILSELRTGNLARAAERLNYMEQRRGSPLEIVDPDVLTELEQRADATSAARTSAASAPEPMRSLLLTAAQADLGGYLCALRLARPLYEQAGPDKAPQYIQLLMAAGLLDEAITELSRIMPRAEATARVAALSEQLGAHLRSQTRVPEPSPWWPAPPEETPDR